MIRYVLSLDGGGIRGTATATFLAKLEHQLGKSIYDSFDLFAGTSTGGIIACALGVLKMPGHKLVEIYNYDNGNKIMNKSLWDRAMGLKQSEPKYDGKGKRETLKQYFGDKQLADAGKPTLVVAYDIEKRTSAVLKSSHQGERAISALDAVDATSAAPLYFPSVKAKIRYLIDGGVIANNPAMCAYVEAVNLWKDDEIRVLSVGTGSRTRPIPGEESQGFGFFGWITHDLLGVVMDESVVDYQARTLLGKRYLRVNSPLDDVNDDMDDCSRGNIEALRRLGDRWFDQFGDQAMTLMT